MGKQIDLIRETIIEREEEINKLNELIEKQRAEAKQERKIKKTMQQKIDDNDWQINKMNEKLESCKH